MGLAQRAGALRAREPFLQNISPWMNPSKGLANTAGGNDDERQYSNDYDVFCEDFQS